MGGAGAVSPQPLSHATARRGAIVRAAPTANPCPPRVLGVDGERIPAPVVVQTHHELRPLVHLEQPVVAVLAPPECLVLVEGSPTLPWSPPGSATPSSSPPATTPATRRRSDGSTPRRPPTPGGGAFTTPPSSPVDRRGLGHDLRDSTASRRTPTLTVTSPTTATTPDPAIPGASETWNRGRRRLRRRDRRGTVHGQRAGHRQGEQRRRRRRRTPRHAGTDPSPTAVCASRATGSRRRS